MQVSIGHIYPQSEVSVNIWTIDSYVHTKAVHHLRGNMTLMQRYQRNWGTLVRVSPQRADSPTSPAVNEQPPFRPTSSATVNGRETVTG